MSRTPAPPRTQLGWWDAPASAPADVPTNARKAPGAEEAATAPATPRIFKVSELVRQVRTTLEARFFEVLVEGEISGFKKSHQGHLYFALKDGDAALDCAMFAREAVRLRFRPEDGLMALARGRLTLFEARGKFQMVVSKLDPTGEGALALAFEQLKQKLSAEGLFAPERKRPLPFLPRRIGVVTSAQGAVLRDIIRVAHRRYPVSIVLAPTAVQGPGAGLQIAAALRDIVKVPGIDVVIVARGGGSLEDLWSFNEEVVARAIAACPVPVISAVGHETDHTIADLVADRRAPTPSAAAEIAVPVAADLVESIEHLRRRLGTTTLARVHERGRVVTTLERRLGDPRRLIESRRQALDDLLARGHGAVRRRMVLGRAAVAASETRLQQSHPARRIRDQRQRLEALDQRLGRAVGATATRARTDLVRLSTRLDRAAGTTLVGRRQSLIRLAATLDALSPLSVLERGYGVVRDGAGRVVTSAVGMRAGDRVHVTVRRGAFEADVTRVIDDSADGAGLPAERPGGTRARKGR